MFDLVERAAPASAIISEFRDAFAWLSNFAPSTLWWEGVCYPTAEHAFQAGKTLDMNLRQQIADAPTPGRAKKLGWSLTPRPGWRDQIRHQVMAEVLAAKFATPSLAAQLVSTGTALLVEGNDHEDNDWGWCRCERHRSRPGHNYLGRALMRLRAQLNPELAGRWTHVAATGHRPHKIPKELRDSVESRLSYATDKLVRERGMEVAISGLAQGVDVRWAELAAAAGARVWGYSPYPEQAQRWSQTWVQRRRAVMNTAERVEHLAPAFGNHHLHNRNHWMVRDAQAIVVVADTSRSSGGTIEAVRYAHQRIPMVLIDLNDDEVRLVQPRATIGQAG